MLYMSDHDQYNIILYCVRYIIIASSTVELYILMHGIAQYIIFVVIIYVITGHSQNGLDLSRDTS